MNIKLSKNISIPAQEFATQGNAILGIRDSGKSYSATYMAEQLLLANIPFVAFDPIGVWRFLKSPGRGDGFPVVVAGGESGDLPLSPQTAPEIVRAAMRENVPLVIDLFDMRLSKADWRKIVEESIRVLLYENKACGPRHIFIEEAAEFVPQQIRDEGRVYAEIEKLARMGGNVSLGYTLINQRAEQVNKAVLELCDCIFLHRQKGKNSLTSLGKWLDFADRKKSSEIIQSLPGLNQGECWVWLAGSDAPEFVKMPAKRSLHPDRRNPHTTAVKASADVGGFVEAIKTALPRLEEERAANDPVALKRRIKELEAELKKPGKITMQQLREIEGKAFRMLLNHTKAQMAGIVPLLQAWVDEHATKTTETAPAQPVVPRQHNSIIRKEVTLDFSQQDTKRPVVTASNSPVAGGMRRMLVALAQRPGLNARQLGVRAGLSSSSGTFGTYLAKLRSNGWIYGGRDCMALTTAGVEALGDYEPLPTGRDLLDYWLRELGSGGASRMLTALADAYPRALTKQDLGAEAGISPGSGTFGTYLSKLRTLELIEGRGEIKLNPELA
ncbi:MAG: ATP-binding protein [Chthoniobacterales bacterium]|nr:ATP-binding protein [Chthoniobacterales bacterium]